MATAAERAQLRSAKAFATGLRPPIAPSICPVCFVYFAKALEPNASITRLLHTRGHAFWNAMMAFVAWKWTREDQDSVSALLAHQNSRCAMCKHTGLVGRLEHDVPDADTWFGLVFQVSRSCLHAGSMNRMVRHGRAGLTSKHGRWPSSAEDLFPYGPDRTIDALVSQLGRFSFVEAVIVNLTALQRSIAFPLLSKAAHCTRIIAYVVRRLTACTTAIKAGLAALSAPAAAAAQRDIVQRHIKLCEGTVLMLHIIGFGLDNQPEDKSEFFMFDIPELFQALHPIVCLLYEEEQYAWMATLASHLWVWLSESERIDCGCPDPPVYGREIDSSASLKDPYRALRYFLALRRTRHQCNGPGCGKLVRDKAPDDRFALCGKCRAMLYCSKECQKADWSRTPFPHKEICDILQELHTFASVDSSMSMSEFSDACRVHAFPLGRVDRLIAWASDGQTISNYAGGVRLVMHPPPRFKPRVEALKMVTVSGEPAERGNVFAVYMPPTADGQVMSQSELNARMLKVKEKMAVKGVEIEFVHPNIEKP